MMWGKLAAISFGIGFAASLVYSNTRLHMELASVRAEVDGLYDEVYALRNETKSPEPAPVPEAPAEDPVIIDDVVPTEYGDPTPERRPGEAPDGPVEEEDPDMQDAFPDSGWTLIRRYEQWPENIGSRTDFQYDTAQDVLLRNGKPVSDEYPALAELMFDEFYLCGDTAVLAALSNEVDPHAVTVYVAIVTTTEDSADEGLTYL